MTGKKALGVVPEKGQKAPVRGGNAASLCKSELETNSPRKSSSSRGKEALPKPHCRSGAAFSAHLKNLTHAEAFQGEPNALETLA